jgi:hypothetical protein
MFSKKFGCIVLLFLPVFSLQAETIENDISSAVYSIKVNGAVDVQLQANAQNNHFTVSYDGEPSSKVTEEYKNGVLSIQSSGVFHDKPLLELHLINAPSEFSVDGVSDSDLQIENAHSLNINLSGVSKAKLTGQADALIFKLSGTSSIDIVGFSAKEITGSLDGISSVYAKKSAPLKVEKQGISNIYYQ